MYTDIIIAILYSAGCTILKR